MQKARNLILAVCLFSFIQTAFPVEPGIQLYTPPPPVLAELLVRNPSRSCDAQLFKEWFLESGVTYSDMIGLFFGLQVIGFQKGFINSGPLHPGLVLNAWEKQGLPLRSYLVTNYPDSMRSRENPKFDLDPHGAFKFFETMRADWQRWDGIMHQAWIHSRVRTGPKKGSVRFLQQFLIEVAFHSQWFDDVDVPVGSTPRAFSFNPGEEDSIATDIALVTYAFGGTQDQALTEFSKRYTEYWYPTTGTRMPRADYLRAAHDLQDKLDAMDIPFAVTIRPDRPLLKHRQGAFVGDSNIKSVLQRLESDKVVYADLPMGVFVAESTDGGVDDNQTSLRMEPLDRYGDFEAFIPRVNAALGYARFLKPDHLTWKQELFVQQAVQYLRSNRYVRQFQGFRIFQTESVTRKNMNTPENPLLSAPMFIKFWQNARPPWNTLIKFNDEIKRRLQVPAP